MRALSSGPAQASRSDPPSSTPLTHERPAPEGLRPDNCLDGAHSPHPALVALARLLAREVARDLADVREPEQEAER
jgi:hypothetical protein